MIQHTVQILSQNLIDQMSTSKNKLMIANHVGLVPKMKKQKGYKNYVIGGGELSYEQWSKKQKKK